LTDLDASVWYFDDYSFATLILILFNVVKNDLTQVERRYLYPTDGTMVSGTALIQKSLNLNNSCTCMATCD